MQYIATEKRYVGNLHLRIALAMDRLRELEKQQAAARAELLRAATERKVIEKLRDKQPAAWRQGKDAQLERAIEVVMQQLKDHPQPEIKRPAYPNYHEKDGLGQQ